MGKSYSWEGSCLTELPRSTRAILDLLSRSQPGASLDVGSFQGAVARAAGCAYLHDNLIACEAARSTGATPVLHSDMLPVGPFHTIYFDAREYDPSLAVETLAQAGIRLAPGGVVITTAPAQAVEELFEQVEAHGEAVIASRPRPGAYKPVWPTYTVTYGDRSVNVATAPGIFSPRGLDTGTAIMLSQIEASPGARFLDLGCGAGVVSLVASTIWGCHVTAVDVSARALRMTATNAPGVEVLPSDGFTQLGDRQFEIVASNPPYHTDFGVAKAFIEGAHRRLTMGGRLCLVVKRADWYVQRIRSVFGGCRVHEEAGYVVITAEKREPRDAKLNAAPPPTTRKHAKRMLQTHRRKR